MIRKSAVRIAVLGAAALLIGGYSLQARQDPGKTIGGRIDGAVDKIKSGAEKVGDTLREGFEKARGKVEGMSMEARVYSRLHWDKKLAKATITLDVAEDGTVVMKGSVANEEAKTHAEMLALDTVGVTKVENQLGIARTTTTTIVKPSDR